MPRPVADRVRNRVCAACESPNTCEEGKPGGEKVLERLAPNPPESLVNLGILHDRRGEARKALDFYKRAAEKGARTTKLREWIDTKDRMIGSGQPQ